MNLVRPSRPRALALAAYICPACQHRRALSATAGLASGHSRWSKIKHDKGSNDLAKNRQRAQLAQEIMLASKMFGPNPALNPRLSTVVATAKKAGFPKASIESSIARGQGMSASGAALESLVIEAMLPPAVAVIVDVQTDNKLRTMQNLRLKIKNHGGTATPTGYMFTKRGRIVLEKDERGAEDVLDQAVEAGAEDVDTDEEGRVVLLTEAASTMGVAGRVEEGLGMKIEEVGVVWMANEESVVEVGGEQERRGVRELVSDLEGEPEVQGVYLNVDMDKWR